MYHTATVTFDLVAIYLVLTFSYHSSLSIDFSGQGAQGVQSTYTNTAFTCGDVANYHNAPVLSQVLFVNVIMATTC